MYPYTALVCILLVLPSLYFTLQSAIVFILVLHNLCKDQWTIVLMHLSIVCPTSPCVEIGGVKAVVHLEFCTRGGKTNVEEFRGGGGGGGKLRTLVYYKY